MHGRLASPPVPEGHAVDVGRPNQGQVLPLDAELLLPHLKACAVLLACPGRDVAPGGRQPVGAQLPDAGIRVEAAWRYGRGRPAGVEARLRKACG